MKSQLLVLLTLAMFVTFSATIAMAELIAHWPLDDGAGAGLTAVDVVGGFDGTLEGDATWDANGKLGGALVVDGNGDYIQTTLMDELQAAENFTIAAWFKTTVTDTGSQHLLWIGDVGGNGWGSQQELHMGVNHNSHANKVSGFFGAGADASLANVNITSLEDFTDTSDWHHLAIAVKNASGPPTTAKLFLDGELVEPWLGADGFVNADGAAFPTTDTATQLVNRAGWNGALRIGAPGAAQRYFNGMIDEVTVWTDALEEDDIQNLDALISVRPGGKLTTTWGALK